LVKTPEKLLGNFYKVPPEQIWGILAKCPEKLLGNFAKYHENLLGHFSKVPKPFKELRGKVP
jgi:hypothetical protein